MEDYKTISWIFLAIALASKTSSTDFAGISMIADGINHAVPTQKELQTAIKWLSTNNLLVKSERKYSLTEIGKRMLLDAESKSNIISHLWNDLELAIKNTRAT